MRETLDLCSADRVDLFSHIVRTDSGFAPNPFFGYCTLACCKPVIRRTASVGDLVVGLTPKALGHRIVYIMRVTEVMPFAGYWSDRRFRRKRPRFATGRLVHKQGDNVYEPLSEGGYIQHTSRHSHPDGTENLTQKKRDLGGKYVLVSDDFVYFGAEAIALPSQFKRITVGRGHRRLRGGGSDGGLVNGFLAFFEDLPRGVQGRPQRWRDDDTSWRGRSCCN